MAYISRKISRQVAHLYRSNVKQLSGLGIVIPFSAIATTAGAAGKISPKLAKGAGIVGGAATGAEVGSAFGPIGTAVGAVFGAAISLLSGKKVAKAELYWDDWRKKAMGKVPGSALDSSFDEAFKGMWDTNNKDFPGYARYKNGREQFKADMANEIVNAAVSGKLVNSDNAQSVYAKVVKPWLETMKPGGIPAKRTDIIQLIVDLVDRYLHDLPIGRADIPDYKGQGYQPSIPLLSEALSKRGPPPTPVSATPTTVKTPDPVSASPVAMPTGPQYVPPPVVHVTVPSGPVSVSRPATPPALEKPGLPGWVIPAAIAVFLSQ